MSEMLLFMLLIMPLPFTFKRKLFTYVPFVLQVPLVPCYITSC